MDKAPFGIKMRLGMTQDHGGLRQAAFPAQIGIDAVNKLFVRLAQLGDEQSRRLDERHNVQPL